MNTNTTVDRQEVAKFAQHASEWWNKDGPLKTLHDINPARIEFIEKFISLSNQRVLDVGCGGGILSEGMAVKDAFVTGLDVEPDAIETAKLHAHEKGHSIDYLCQPIETYESDQFTLITCMEMLEHVQEPCLVIEHCARLLKKGGYLFLSTINRTLQAYSTVILAAEYLLQILPRQTHDFDKFIKPSELANMVRRCGLETVGMSGLSYNPITRTAALCDSVTANYLLACRKPFPL
jgi:2-polyprenyl-6-hydroxyphenyl methylase/3-demethylubiquinone-9 3-methyltransferase